MAITAGDLKFRLSGGSANATPDNSIGGLMSLAASITDNTANNLWDDVTGAEANAGDTEYRCFFFRMSHATLNLTSAYAFVSETTDSADDEIYVGMETDLPKVGNSYWVQSVANESTAPANVSFIASTVKADGLNLGTVEPCSTVAFWVERVVDAAAAAQADNYWSLEVQGDTAA